MTNTLKKLTNTISVLQVEPGMTLCITGVVLFYLRSENILLRRICEVNFGYEKHLCDNFIAQNDTDDDLEVEIQKEMVEIKSYNSLFMVLTVLVILITGPLSNIWGRKFPMILATLGNMGMSLSLILLLEFTNANAHVLSFTSQSFSTLGGGNVAFAMAAFSHIVDITSHEERSWRLGVMTAFQGIGSPLAFLIGGLLSDYNITDIHTLYIVLGIHTLSLLIVLFLLKSPKITNPDSHKSNSFLRLPKEFIHTLIKPRKDHGRLKLWALIIAFLFAVAPSNGEFQLLYLFLRKRLNWNLSQYSYFSIVVTVIKPTGILLAMWILSRKLNLSDPLIGIFGGISQISACISYAFSYTSLAMYASSVIDLFSETLQVIPRTMISKLVSIQEAGTLFTILAVINVTLPSGLIPLYTLIYNKSLEVDFEGGFNLLSLGLSTPAFIIIIVFYWRFKRNQSKLTKLENKIQET